MHDPGLWWPQIEEHLCGRLLSSCQPVHIIAAFSSECLSAWVCLLFSLGPVLAHQQSIPARSKVPHGLEPERFARLSAQCSGTRDGPQSLSVQPFASRSTRQCRPTLCVRRRWLLRMRSACGSHCGSRVCTRVCAVDGAWTSGSRHSMRDMDSGRSLRP